ncbi:hypothetical protein ACFQU1_05445 [Chelatococcus sp. GCM10030263]|uniref:hypothetical protein n=1 Tax=Chelatococcus sp. GCM10030263 TaxID=3273387 RepID=UPI0036245066
MISDIIRDDGAGRSPTTGRGASLGGQARTWWRFAVTFLGTSFAVACGFLLIAFLVDPFDSGRSPLQLAEGVPEQINRFANASRARDPAFRAAIFGNSRIQLIEPAVLTAGTGIPFVSLGIEGSYPREQLATLDWFLAHHPDPAVIVVGIDGVWCESDLAQGVHPFPYWLYSPSTLTYLRGLFRATALEGLGRYGAYVLGGRPRARPDGFWNYETLYLKVGMDSEEKQRALLRHEFAADVNLTGRFPAADELATRLQRLPRETKVVLLRPPVFYTGLPMPGSPEAAAEAACLDRFTALVRSRPNTFLLDWRVDRPEVREQSAFFDHTHYRKPVARRVEEDLIAMLRRSTAKAP